MLVVSGCSDSKKDTEVQGPPSTNADGTPVETVPNGDTVPGQGPTSTTRKAGSPSSPSPTTTASSTTSTTRNVSRPPNAADSGARSGPGAFARTLLRPQPATRIVIELQVQAGAEPRQTSIDHLLAVLREESRKQVVLGERVTLPASDSRTTADEIRSWADTYAKAQQGADQAVLRVLFLKGEFHQPTPDTRDEDGADALGVAVRGDTMAIFKDTVNASASPLVSATVIEDAVTTHELGHLLGLVDIVLRTGRQDPEHEGHSRNPDSVMYWAVEVGLVEQVRGGPPSTRFDSDDKNDLAAIRNGA